MILITSCFCVDKIRVLTGEVQNPLRGMCCNFNFADFTMKAENESLDCDDLYKLFMSSNNDKGGEQDQIIHQSSKFLKKVNFVLELFSKYNIDNKPNYIRDRKNNNKSSELRNKGNKLFSSKKYEEALEMYTYSIALAEDKSENLGLAYANRSAVLFRFGLFEECLKDIERALENNYPDALKSKIIERKNKTLNLKTNQELVYHQPIPSIDVNDRNPLIECASNCVEIKKDSKYGRFIVATRDIEIGEIIAVENPTFSILIDAKWCHCHHCLKLCYNLLPCNDCTKALFCSSECKYNAISYHKYECQILATFESTFHSSWLLTIRIAISLRDQYENFEVKLQESDKLYKSERYKEIHNLVTNEMYRSDEDIFKAASKTAIFYNILKDYTDFFEDSKDLKDIFLELVFRNVQILNGNSYSIIEKCENSTGSYKVLTIGIGLYNFMSLFNHSCAPNVDRTNFGSSMALSAIETIRKGEQLFINYGIRYCQHSKIERKAYLKKNYYFDCDCRACKNNWGFSLPNKIGDEKSILFLLNHLADLFEENLKVARTIQPIIIETMKKIEEFNPCNEYQILQCMLEKTNNLFGNLRRCLT